MREGLFVAGIKVVVVACSVDGTGSYVGRQRGGFAHDWVCGLTELSDRSTVVGHWCGTGCSVHFCLYLREKKQKANMIHHAPSPSFMGVSASICEHDHPFFAHESRKNPRCRPAFKGEFL